MDLSPLQIVLISLAFTIPLLGWALLFRQVARFWTYFRLGQPAQRTDNPTARSLTVVKEFLGHTRMSRLPVVAIAHWFTALSFFLLFATLVQFDNPAARAVWAGITPAHQQVVRYVLEQAVASA